MKLEQDKQFVPSDEILIKLLKYYELALVSYKAATSGIENTTLIVQTDLGKYVARVYRQGKKSIESINQEIDFMRYLGENDIKVPSVLRNIFNEYVVSFEHNNVMWQLIVMNYVVGVHSVKYPKVLVEDMSSTQAKMHNLSSQYILTNSSVSQLKVLKESYFISQINIYEIKNDDLVKFLQRAASYELVLDHNLPKGLCHLDFDKDNIITKNNLIEAVLDFDDLEIAPFIVCLGYTLWHIQMYGSRQMMEHYLAKYEEIRSLNELENNYLSRIMLFRHYVISSLKILNGHRSEIETAKYIRLENALVLQQ